MKKSWAMGSIVDKDVEARVSLGRRRPLTETEVQLPHSSASLLEERWNQAVERFSAISLYLQVVEARFAAVWELRRLAILCWGAGIKAGNQGPTGSEGGRGRSKTLVTQGLDHNTGGRGEGLVALCQ